LLVKLGVFLALAAATLYAQTAPPSPAPVQEQVTVTANRSAIPIGEAAKTTYELDSEQVHDYPAVTLDETLRQHAGFELFRRAGSRVANPTSEGISLRGLGSTAVSRTLVLEDGAPLNDPFGGWIHWSESPQQTIESVTLVSGGGSDLYGSSALGGVIDVLPATASPSRFDISGEGGSQSTSDLTATGTRVGRLLDGLVAGESLRTGGYIVTDPSIAGTVDVPANVISQTYHTEIGRRDFKTDRLFLTGNLLNEAHGNGTPLQTNATRLWRYVAGYDLPETRNVASRVRLFGSDEGYRQSFSSIAANRGSETLTRLQRVHTQELGATGDATVHLGHVAGVAGADARDIRAEDNETPISKGLPNGLADVTARQRFLGGFGEALGEYKGWSGAASLRADRASNLDIVQTAATLTASTVTKPADRTEVILSPRAGLVRSLGTHAEVHASGFRAFREPSMNELYRTGQVGSQTTLPNAGLLSERATGWEAGTKVSAARATLQATYFWTEINRPVSAVLVTQTATTTTLARENLGQIRSRGVEVSANFNAGHAVSATVGYQYADATVTQFSAQPALVGNWIPEVPRQSFTAQVHATGERLGELTVAMRASGMEFDDANNQFVLNGFFSLDVSGRRSFGRHAEVFFLVQNVTDQRPQVAKTPTLTLGSPIFGEAGVRLRFGGP
jgi:outer membrane receptor protein involved in Fe transport